MFCLIFAKNKQNGNNQKENRALLGIIFTLCCCFFYCIGVAHWLLLFNGIAFQHHVFSQGTGPDVSCLYIFYMPFVNSGWLFISLRL